MTIFAEFVEPYGPNNEGVDPDSVVVRRVNRDDAVRGMLRVHPYKSDREVFEDFLSLHWAYEVYE